MKSNVEQQYPAVNKRYTCPISAMVMRHNVVIASDGRQYQKEFILRVLNGPASSRVSPITREVLKPDLYSDIGLKEEIEEFLQNHPQLFDKNSPVQVYLPEIFWDNFFEAIREKNVRKFDDLIKKDPRLLQLTPQQAQEEGLTYSPEKILPNITALQCAIENRSLKIVNRIRELNGELPLESLDELYNNNPQIKLNIEFLEAVTAGDLPKVKALFSQGANVNTNATIYGQTPLHKAVLFNHDEVVQFLLSEGKAILTKDIVGRMPQHYAARKNLNILKLLISQGAELGVRDRAGFTLLHHAVRDGAIDVIRFLLEQRVQFDADDINETLLLFLRIYTDLRLKPVENVTIVNLLIQAGADVKTHDANGHTPLHLAGEEELIKILLEKGANPNAKDIHGCTPLAYRETWRNVLSIGKVKLLLQHGANPNGAEDFTINNTPLANAVIYNQTDVALELLKYNACPHFLLNGRGASLNSAVLSGIMKSNPPRADENGVMMASIPKNALIEALLKKGANIIVSDTYGHREHGCREVLEEIEPIARRLNCPLQVLKYNEANEAITRATEEYKATFSCVNSSSHSSQFWASGSRATSSSNTSSNQNANSRNGNDSSLKKQDDKTSCLVM